MLLERLLPLARLITPNRPEIAKLTGLEVSDMDSSKSACRRLYATTKSPVLLKGGHGPGGDLVDVLFEGSRFYFMDSQATRGRGGGVPRNRLRSVGCHSDAIGLWGGVAEGHREVH